MKMLSNVVSAISDHTDIFKTNVQAHSPEILICAGVIGMVTSTVLACRATIKAKTVLDERQKNLETVEKVKTDPENADGALYSKEDAKKDVGIINVQTGLKVVGLYLPAVTVGVLGVLCLVKSNDIHRRHEASLMGAYISLDQLFKKYRERVKAELGEEMDDHFRIGSKTVEVEKEYVDENGKKKKKKETVEMLDDIDPSDFSFVFDCQSAYWDNDPMYARSIVLDAMSNLNTRLENRARLNKGVGYVRYDELLIDLGIQRPKYVDELWKDFGWVLDTNNPNLSSTKIELKFKEMTLPPAGEHVYPRRGIVIVPNVQGNIFELMR